MAVTGKYKSRAYSFIKGLDQTSNTDTTDTEGTLSIASNCDLVNEAIAVKRNGYQTVNSTVWSTRRIRQGVEYVPVSGIRQQIVYGEAATLTGTSGILGYMNGTAAPTTITSSLKDDVKPSFVQLKNLLFCFNGTDDFVYNGTTTTQIGITEPSVAPTLNTTISGGSLNSGGTYVYVYTYYNSATGAESSPSLPSATLTSGTTSGTRGIRINVTAGSSTTADKIFVYRTVSGGNVYFFDGETTISATSYDSIVSDAGLGNELELDNSRLAEKGRYAQVTDNRLFVAGFSSNPSRIHYSKIGLSGPMPQSFQAADFVDCNSSDGDSIIGLSKAGDTIIVLKNRSVGRLVSIQASGVGLERAGSSKYLYQEISKHVTGCSHHTMTPYDTYCIWLGTDDVYGTDGAEIYRLGTRIRNIIQALDFQRAAKFSVINKVDTKQIIWSVVATGDTEPRNQLVGHYRYFSDVGLAFTEYKPGTNTSTHPGIPAACFFEATESGQTKIYFGSSAADGTIYRLNSGGTDNTYGIYFDVRGPWESLGIPAARKMYLRYDMSALGAAGGSYSITHTFEKDLVETVDTTYTTALTGSGTAWNAANWNAFNWSSQTFSPLVFRPHTRARYGRYGCQQTGANQPVAIRGLVSTIGLDPIGS